MNCPNCNAEIQEGTNFCLSCGAQISNAETVAGEENKGKATTSLVLGLVGLFAWFLPIAGLPVGIVGIVMGVKGLKSSSKGLAIAGIILSSICVLASLANSILGVIFAFSNM